MGERTNRRTCDRCGSVLARDNPGSLCNPCARTVVGDSAAVPAHSTIFWEHPNIKAALGARHFGHLMYAYRLAHDPPVTQAELGHWLGLTQGQVSRIERSASPVRDLERLDRWARVMRVPSDKLWFQPDPHAADVPEETACASDLISGVDTEGEDVRRRELLRTAALGVITLGASVGHLGPSTIGSTEVAVIREMTDTWRRLDNRYGGGHTRSTVAHYLAHEVEPMIRNGRAASLVKQDLSSAVAELHHLAGWMAYDTGDSKAGHLHLQQALRLCRDAADNHALAAEMLAGMSHQAAFARQRTLAVDLALAARQTAQDVASDAFRLRPRQWRPTGWLLPVKRADASKPCSRLRRRWRPVI